MTKYETIAQTDLFRPIAIETSGVFGPGTSAILCDLAHRIKDISIEPNSKANMYLLRCRGAMQHLSWGVLG